MKKLNKIKCPKCGKSSSRITQGQEGTLYYIYDLEIGEWESGEHQGSGEITWYCYYCGDPLPAKIGNQLNKIV